MIRGEGDWLADRLEKELKELNSILLIGNDYDAFLLSDIYYWWQKPGGVREMFDKDYRSVRIDFKKTEN